MTQTIGTWFFFFSPIRLKLSTTRTWKSYLSIIAEEQTKSNMMLEQLQKRNFYIEPSVDIALDRTKSWKRIHVAETPNLFRIRLNLLFLFNLIGYSELLNTPRVRLFYTIFPSKTPPPCNPSLSKLPSPTNPSQSLPIRTIPKIPFP